ncbi:MAG: iron ABC transporter permease [Planctomycetota bacterium]|nr:iron ABC transporter permease [Planctomycetota bacterium]
MSKNSVTYLLLGGLLACVCVLAVFVGAVDVPLRDFMDSSIIRLRMARILLAVAAGAGLSVAGVLFQGILRNPLAEPYVLGVSSGAGLGATVAILLGAAAYGSWTLPAMAFVGALLAVVIVYALGSVGRAMPVHTLLLAGIVVGTILNSILMFLVSYPWKDQPTDRLHNVVWWMMGNLEILDSSLLLAVCIIVACATSVAVLLGWVLNVLALGEEPAAHLGIRVERTKKLFFVLGSLVTGAIVAACGLIGFVGLIVPHTMRMIVGPDHRRLLPASALAGAVFLVVADAFARSLLATEIPIGVVTAVVGGPFFLVLLRRRRRPL